MHADNSISCMPYPIPLLFKFYSALFCVVENTIMTHITAIETAQNVSHDYPIALEE